MHDRNGTPLRVGDLVQIPARVVSLSAGDDYCNAELETLFGRRPDGAKEKFYSCNTGCVVLMERFP